MIHVWNVYESGDPLCPGPDPYDIFLYAIRKEEEPHLNDSLYVEGKLNKIFACCEDVARNEMLAIAGEKFWKVCVK